MKRGFFSIYKELINNNLYISASSLNDLHLKTEHKD